MQKKVMAALSRSSAFVFDFDGTVYPGILLADAAGIYFSKSSEYARLAALKQLSIRAKVQPFEATLSEFSDLIAGVDVNDFNRVCLSLFPRCYASFPKVVSVLSELHIPCYLSSLTSEFVARCVSERFDLAGYSCFEYSFSENGRRFSALSAFAKTRLTNAPLSQFKLDKLSAMGVVGNFIAAGYSLQDKLVLDTSSFRIGINPSSDLADYPFDLLIRNSADPWEEVLSAIHD